MNDRRHASEAFEASTPRRHAPREDLIARARRIKAITALADVVRAHGVTLLAVGRGRRLVGRCPFHEEARPSFTVYPDTHSYYCFGCHASGDVIAFERRITGCGFIEALDRLEAAPRPQRARSVAQVAGAVAETSESDETSMVRQHPPQQGDEPESDRRSGVGSDRSRRYGLNGGADPAPPDDLRTMLLSVVVALGIQGLAHAPQALTYLGARGLSFATARRLRLGYFEEGALLDYLAGETELTSAAVNLGLLTRIRRCPLARRLLIPEVREGRVTQIIGRVVPEARSPLPQLKYYLACATGEKGLLGYGAARARLAAMREPRRGVLVVEGAIDYALAVDWRAPVALLGAYPSARQLTELLQLQQSANGAPILLLLDADPAGEQGCAALRLLLSERNVAHRVIGPLSVPAQGAVKDLGALGLLGQQGHAQFHATIMGALDGPSAEGEGAP